MSVYSGVGGATTLSMRSGEGWYYIEYEITQADITSRGNTATSLDTSDGYVANM